MNKQQLYKDLVKEYDELDAFINSLDAFINSLDFEEQVPDFIERELLRGKRRCMSNYRDNLKARIKCIECQIKKEENDRQALDDWMSMKGKVINTLCGPVKLVNTDEQHHCGQDADCDDACCQARGNKEAPCPVDDGNAVGKEVPDSIKNLFGMQVVSVNGEKCSYCVTQYYAPCVKVELVGGYTLCLAKLPNSIVTE